MTNNLDHIKKHYSKFIQNNPISSFLFLSSTTLIILITCLIVYMIIFEVDIVTNAYGKIIPEGKIKIIQPAIGGKILKIHVHEGQLVKTNSELITLDSEQYEHDLNSAHQELKLLECKIQRIEKLIGVFKNKDSPILITEDILTDSGLYNEIFSFKEQIKGMKDSLEMSSIELQIKNSEIATSQKNIDYINYKINITKKLLDKVVPKASLLELENNLENSQHQKEHYEHSYKVKQKEREVLETKLSCLQSDLIFKSYYELDNLKKNKNLTIQSIEKLKHAINNMHIKAPITGYVENLKIYNIMGVVASGEALMNIVPLDAQIKLEANMHSRDIGFVKNGHKVAIKFDAFPYTQYGTLKGKICKISNDSFSSDNINYFYKIDVCLEKDYLSIKGINHKINLGYTAQIDIYTDRRRIIDFFLAPIKTAISNSFKEK